MAGFADGLLSDWMTRPRRVLLSLRKGITAITCLDFFGLDLPQSENMPGNEPGMTVNYQVAGL